MSKKLLFRLFALVAALMCALGAVADETYACYTPSNTTLTFYYDNLRSTRTGTTYDLNTGSNDPDWESIGANVTRVVFDLSFANESPTTTYSWFYGMRNLQSIVGINRLRTSEVTNMAWMFGQCSSLTSLDVTHFSTENVTNMNGMFYECSGLTSLDLSSFSTGGVTNMNRMFESCSDLTTIYAGCDWSTGSVTSSSAMFYGCYNLVGGKGTAYSSSHQNVAYAHIDGGSSNPGYFTTGKEAYACYTSSNTTLTFYYDTQRASRTGDTYSISYSRRAPAVPYLDPSWHDCCNSVTRVVFNSSFANYRPTETFFWFMDMSELRSITGLNYLNTSEVTNMQLMFEGCSSLTSLDLSSFNTDNLMWMSSMFAGCSGLTSLNLSGFNTARVITMYNLFERCSGLTSLDLSSFNTAQVANMSDMFYECSSLTSLNLSSFNTARVGTMDDMFYGCSSLTSLDLSNFNTTNVARMYGMFSNCTRLQTIYAGSGWSTDAIINIYQPMFNNCVNIKGGQGTTYDYAHIDGFYAHIDGGTTNPGYLTAGEAYACYTPSNTTLTFYCDGKRSSRTGTTYDLNTGSNKPGWYYAFVGEDSPFTRVAFDPSFADARPLTTSSWFYGMSNLTSITGMKDYLNTSEVTDMSCMFQGCSSLMSLDLSGFNTVQVTDMSYMFRGCSGLTSLDLGGFNTALVTNMSYMFHGCSGLTSLDLRNFNTAQVTDMQRMFSNCNQLTSLDVSSFNTAKVTGIGYMFYGCERLENLDVSSFNTSLLTDMTGMFQDCKSITELNLVGFNTTKAVLMTSMFNNCINLTTIYTGLYWSTAKVTQSNNMFNNCTSLVGSMGTTYDPSHTDKAYAHIDGGTANPGYLSEFKEAYACYIPSYSTLSFYYDGLRRYCTGTTYDLNDANHNPGWLTDSTCLSVTNVFFDPLFASARPTSTRCWFSKMGNLTTITGINYLNTEDVTYMGSMFSGCTKLTSLDLSRFNTANVTNMGDMFNGCSQLTSLDLSSFNTAKVTNMGNMFNGCSQLTSLDLSSFNTAKVTNMQLMFYNCRNLTTIYAGSGWNTDAVTGHAAMFTQCINLVGGKGTTYDANHLNKAYAHIDGGPDNPGYFTDINAAEAYACYTASNTTLTFYYDKLRRSRSGTTYSLNYASHNPNWLTDSTSYSVTKVVFNSSFAGARPTTTRSWFSKMGNLTSITGINYLNTEDVTYMGIMFSGCTKLTSLDLSSFNTANVTDMQYMFSNCSQLTSLDLSVFNTAKVTNMQNMFYNCSNLTTIYAGSEWNTDAVTKSTSMFYRTINLVGGQGTTFDFTHTDKAYAHIDGGPSNPGYFTEGTAVLLGDVDGDGQVKIGDVTALINYLLSGDASAINLQAADCDQDGNIKIGDVTTLINYLLSGSWN